MSGGGRVKFTLAADGQRMEQALERLIARTEKLERTNKKLKESMNQGLDESTRKQKTFFEKVQDGAKNFVTAYLGPGSIIFAIHQVNRALQEQIYLQGVAKERTYDLGQSKRRLGNLLKGEDQSTIDAFLGLAGKSIDKGVVTQINEPELVDLVAAMVSKTSGDPARRIMQTMKMMPLLDEYKLQEMQNTEDFAKSAVTLSGMLGASDPRFSEKLASEVTGLGAAMLARGVSQTALEDLSGTRYMTRAISAALNSSEFGAGLKPSQVAREKVMQSQAAMAWFATQGQNEADPRGMKTGTAVATRISALENLMPTETTKVGKAEFKPVYDKAGEMIDQLDERLKVIAGMTQAYDAEGNAISQDTWRTHWRDSFKSVGAATSQALTLRMFTPGTLPNRQLVENIKQMEKLSYDDMLSATNRVKATQMEDDAIRAVVTKEKLSVVQEQQFLENKNAVKVAKVRAALFGDDEGGLGAAVTSRRPEAAGWRGTLWTALNRIRFETAQAFGKDPMDIAESIVQEEETLGADIGGVPVFMMGKSPIDLEKFNASMDLLRSDLQYQTRSLEGIGAGATGPQNTESR